jgi:hypothetical protein
MTDKPATLAFQPAPRPTPRVTADVAAQLAGATADLGFSRASSAPTDPVAAPVAEKPPFQPAPRPMAKVPASPPVQSKASRRREARPPRQARPSASEGGLAALKLDIPEELWTKLRIEAVKRRITVKYLVLEALANQGYLDLSAFEEDGRRLR